LPEFSGILQTEQSNPDDFGIRLRCEIVKTESSNCNSNLFSGRIKEEPVDYEFQ